MPTQPEEHENPWKWGIFYFNPADKRLLVPKRSNLGWTFNFAHWLSYVFIALIIAVPVVVEIMVARSKK